MFKNNPSYYLLNYGFFFVFLFIFFFVEKWFWFLLQSLFLSNWKILFSQLIPHSLLLFHHANCFQAPIFFFCGQSNHRTTKFAANKPFYFRFFAFFVFVHFIAFQIAPQNFTLFVCLSMLIIQIYVHSVVHNEAACESLSLS